MHKGTTEEKTPPKAIRLRGLYTLLTKGNKLGEVTKEKKDLRLLGVQIVVR